MVTQGVLRGGLMLALFIFPILGFAAEYPASYGTLVGSAQYTTCNAANQYCVTSADPQTSCDGSWAARGAYHGTYTPPVTCTGYRNSDGAFMGQNTTAHVCESGYTWNNSTYQCETQGYSCPQGGTLSGTVCIVVPACGTDGTTYQNDYPSNCTIGDTPTHCPGLGEIHHPVTGACFMPPICEPPQFLSPDQTQCLNPSCGAGKVYNEALKRCVVDPPTCGPNQHLVGNKDSTFAPYCENNPDCPPGQYYGYGVSTPSTGSQSLTGCFGPQNCPDGKVWGTVNGLAGCYGGQLDPKPLPKPPAGTTPNPNPTPPTGGQCTDCGKATHPQNSSSGGTSGGSSGGVSGGVSGGASGSGGASSSGTGSASGGMCQTGACLCNPKAANLPQSEIKCPSSGQCPPNYYSTPGGSCSKAKGDCEAGQHFEFSEMSCVPDTVMKDAADQKDEAITQRLDKIIENTQKTYKNLELPALATQTAGSFGSQAQDALTAAKTELQTKYDEVKAGLQGFVGNLSGASGLPVFDMGTVKGQQVVHDMNRWAEQLSYVGLAVLALAALVAFEIVFKRGT